MAIASPATTSTTRLAPRSGFRSPQFFLGLGTVLLTFVLSFNGITLPGNLAKILSDAASNNIVPGVIAIAVVAGLIAVTFWLETRNVRRKGTSAVKPGKPIPAGGKPFYQTSEFWLGLVTVGLNYLESTKLLDKYTILHFSPNASVTTMAIALVYTFARAQLKQAYINAQETDEPAK